MNEQERKQARVDAQNALNLNCKDLMPLVMGHFANFIGQKIIKVDGTFLQSFRDGLPPFNRPGFRFLWKVGRFSVRVDCTQEVSTSERTFQAFLTFYVANVEGTIVKSVYDPAEHVTNARTDLTVEEIESGFQEIIRKEKEISAIRSKLGTLGHSSNNMLSPYQ